MAAGSARELANAGDAERSGSSSRAQNLGVLRWSVWSRGTEGSVLDDAVDPAAPLSSSSTSARWGRTTSRRSSRRPCSRRLWERRCDRSPVLVVIDEAHNVCPADPEDPLTALATEHAVRIAGEGRKFGLYLLVSTQRPQKVHENVLSQCDNLLLMRMNSTADLGFVADVFSFVPRACSSARPPSGRGSRSLPAGSRRTRRSYASARG